MLVRTLTGVYKLLFDRFAAPVDSNLSSFTQANTSNSAVAVGMFSHHRDAKVAIEELVKAGFSPNWITLVARNLARYSWLTGLNLSDRFDEQIFEFDCNNFQHLFQRLFQQGKYFILVTGTKNEVNSASTIMGRRLNHAKVWHFLPTESREKITN
ncbi:hypothetical protein IQ255_21820 [Pleurocapsales cyanobacterium LEGE 10410]|nr:hypothetical protein [Pleurocapsales cyanobacterium LEGE 10410]